MKTNFCIKIFFEKRADFGIAVAKKLGQKAMTFSSKNWKENQPNYQITNEDHFCLFYLFLN